MSANGNTDMFNLVNGNVGIGTSSPAVKTHIAASSYTAPTGGLDPNIKLLINNSQYCGMQILGSSTGSSFIHFGDQDNADVGLITYEHNGDYMRFDVNALERLRIAGNNLHLNGGTDARIQLGTGGAGANSTSNNTVHIRGDGADMKLMAASGGSYVFEQNGTERLRIDSSGNVGIGGSTTYSSSLIATDIGTRDFTIYSTSSDAGNYIVLTDNSSSANISYGTEGNTHILRADTTNRFQADNDGIKVFGGAAGANGVRISGKSQGEQLARQYCARTGGLIRYVSAGSGSLNGDLDAISDGDALLIAPGSYTITRKTSGYTSEHNPFREKECGIFGDTNFPGDVTISHNADADTDIRDHPIWCARWNGLFTHPLFLGFIKYVRNPSTPYNTNYSDAIVNGTFSDGSTQMICGGAQNVIFDFNGTNVAWVYDNANAVHYMRFKNCTFSNYNTWEVSYSGNLADGYVWHCVFKGSDSISGYINSIGYDIAGSYGSITNRTLLSKGNRHGVSLSGTGSNSGTYNVDTYAGAGHLQYDPFPTIFWDDQNWPGDY